MASIRFSFVLTVLTAAFALTGSFHAPAADAAQADQAAPAPESFVNRVWTVAESRQVSTGSLRVFLSDGTLVMASPHSTPAFGRWRYGDGHLTITEESISYPVDILALDSQTFTIRIRGPGEPIVMRMVPAASSGSPAKDAKSAGWVVLATPPPGSEPLAITGTVHRLELEGGQWVIRDAQGTQYDPTNLPEAFRRDGMPVEVQALRRDRMASIGMVGPIVELLRIRARPEPAAATPDFMNSSWQLEDLGGSGVLDRVQATLVFAEGGKVSGNSSCNHFKGTVTIDGDAIAFGPLATTRMTCVEAVMRQEHRYLAALHDVTRFKLEGSTLYLYTNDESKPLQFIREQ